MPRQSRKKSSTGIYHVILRGVNRQNIFEDDKDRQKLMETIGYYKEISSYKLYGYCLMNNHIHLLIKETEESISNIVKRISSSYVYWYNKRYDRCGHLFQERFKSEVVETDAYFVTVLRYIHQNPIKAGIIKEVEKYLWSSYREYIGNSIYTDINFALGLFSEDKIKAIKLFEKYMNEENDDQCLEYTEKLNISDDEVIGYFHNIGIDNISKLQRIEKEKRNEYIRKIKNIEGITVRQLARVTGISKSVIGRI
jgi:REP element-mobilizing transposase RayT